MSGDARAGNAAGDGLDVQLGAGTARGSRYKQNEDRLNDYALAGEHGMLAKAQET